MQPEQKKSLFKRGFGVGGATLVALIGTSLLMLAINKATGAFISMAIVILLCLQDRQLRMRWRVIMAVILVAIVYIQYQGVTKR
jgi:amino acid permease